MAHAQPDQTAQYQVYPLEHKSVDEVGKLLSELLSTLDEPTHLVANRKKNQVLLQGSDRAQRIARQLIESVDQPPVKQADDDLDDGPEVRSYACPPQQLKSAVDLIRRSFPDQQDLRVAADPQTRQLLVVALPDMHERIAHLLEAEGFIKDQGLLRRTQPRQPKGKSRDRPGENRVQETRKRYSRARAESVNPYAARGRTADRPGQSTVRLRNTRVERVERSLKGLFGSRLKRRGAGSAEYEFSDANKLKAQVVFDANGDRILLEGPQSLVDQLALLLRVLDGPGQPTGQKVRVIPLRRSDPAIVKEALDAYRDGYRARQDPRNDNRGRESGGSVPAQPPRGEQHSRHSHDGPFHNGSIELVRFQEPALDAPAPIDDVVPPGDDDRLPGDALRELGPDVDIETLPDLDVIIIRGSNRDVSEVTRIIKEIERLSKETVPVVEIVALEHVNSLSAAQLILLVEEDLVGARQGRVIVEALVKPNALLLVGWGEAIIAMKELIEKLDQPVAPETQIKVFRLRHASAGTAAATVQQMYAERVALSTQVKATADIRSNSLVVQASPRDMAEIELLLKKLDTSDSDAVNQFRIFKLKNSLATDTAETLQTAIDAASGPTGGTSGKSSVLELLSVDRSGGRVFRSGVLADVKITPDAQRNALLVTAPAESMELISALIKQLDASPTSVAQIKVFPIVNGDSADLVQMLRSLMPTQTGSSVGERLPGGSDESSLAPLRFAIDTRTNSIIATGSKDDLLIIDALLLGLDDEESQQRKNKVYRLKNSPALDVASAINEFLRNERLVQQAAPGSESPFLRIEREVVVVPEIVSNSLILSATERYFDAVEEIINELDGEPPQVIIQVLIAEVALRDEEQMGAELGIQDSVLFDRSLLGDLATTTQTFQTSTPAGILTSTQELIQAATNTPGLNFNGTPLAENGNSGSSLTTRGANHVAGQALSNFAVNRADAELGFGGLVLSAGSESISVLIRALQESRRLEVLSRPEITTLDNQPAFIQIGQRVPRIVSSNISQNLGQVNQIEMENVGIMMAVTPRISPDGMVVMEVDAEKSELAPEEEGIPVTVSPEGTIVRSPRINITRAQTTVSAASGETIVLGGLISNSVSEIHRRVPWLSDVPLLGHLFQFNSMSNRRVELLIILTPKVIRNPDDIELIKHQEAARMHWACSNVHDVYGEAGLCSGIDCQDCDTYAPVIYPDLNPRGLMPTETLPDAPLPDDIPETEVPQLDYPDAPRIEPPSPQSYRSEPSLLKRLSVGLRPKKSSPSGVRTVDANQADLPARQRVRLSGGVSISDSTGGSSKLSDRFPSERRDALGRSAVTGVQKFSEFQPATSKQYQRQANRSQQMDVEPDPNRPRSKADELRRLFREEPTRFPAFDQSETSPRFNASTFEPYRR